MVSQAPAAESRIIRDLRRRWDHLPLEIVNIYLVFLFSLIAAIF